MSDEKLNTNNIEIDSKEFEETIGLLGSNMDDINKKYNITRASKRKRIAEIMSIVKKYDVFKGLTPVKFRMMLEELGPVKTQIGRAHV